MQGTAARPADELVSPRRLLWHATCAVVLMRRLQAVRIVGERTASVDGKERKEYLVVFEGLDHPEWASGVTKDLLAVWERDAPSSVQAALKQACAVDALPATVSMESVEAFQAKSLLLSVQRVLRAGIKFSTKVAVCMVRRHHVRVPFMTEVAWYCERLCSFYRSLRLFSASRCRSSQRKASCGACLIATATRSAWTRRL